MILFGKFVIISICRDSSIGHVVIEILIVNYHDELIYAICCISFHGMYLLRSEAPPIKATV